MKETDNALRSYGYTHLFSSRDTESEFSVWQRKDIVLVRDDRTNKVISTSALDSFGRAERGRKP